MDEQFQQEQQNESGQDLAEAWYYEQEVKQESNDGE